MNVRVDVHVGRELGALLAHQETERERVTHRDGAEHSLSAPLRRDLVAKRDGAAAGNLEVSRQPVSGGLGERIVHHGPAQHALALVVERERDRVGAPDGEDLSGLPLDLDARVATEQRVD